MHGPPFQMMYISTWDAGATRPSSELPLSTLCGNGFFEYIIS